MKITVHTCVKHDVELTDYQVKEITINYLKSLLQPGQFLRVEDGKMVVKKGNPLLSDGEHVREASELDMAIFKVLERIIVGAA